MLRFFICGQVIHLLCNRDQIFYWLERREREGVPAVIRLAKIVFALLVVIFCAPVDNDVQAVWDSTIITMSMITNIPQKKKNRKGTSHLEGMPPGCHTAWKCNSRVRGSRSELLLVISFVFLCWLLFSFVPSTLAFSLPSDCLGSLTMVLVRLIVRDSLYNILRYNYTETNKKDVSLQAPVPNSLRLCIHTLTPPPKMCTW